RDDVQRIYSFGENVGIAFQLQDDILDLYADPDKFGKQVGGDILANKKTFLLLKAFELADNEQQKKLQELSEEVDEQMKVEETRKIFDQLGVGELARIEMERHYALALESMELVTVSAEKKKPLLQVAEYLMHREV